MLETFNAVYLSLHVRVTNRAAFSLYKDTLQFKVVINNNNITPNNNINYSINYNSQETL